jgi:hypothetical protein
MTALDNTSHVRTDAPPQNPALASEAAAHLSGPKGGDTGAIASATSRTQSDTATIAKTGGEPSAAPGSDKTATASAAAGVEPHRHDGTTLSAAAGKADATAAPGTPAAKADATAAPGTPAAAPLSPVDQTTANIEKVLKANPNDDHMSSVYKELDGLRKTEGKNFGKDLEGINKKLHADGLLPGLTIMQDKYTGTDGKEHAGFSIIANDPKNPAHRVGTEVSNNHDSAKQTPESTKAYNEMAQHAQERAQAQSHDHGHGGHHGHHGRHHGRHHRHHHFDPMRDSAESGRASHGGFDRHLIGGSVPKGERKELIDKALAKAGIPQTEQYEKAMNKIITRESGWNPNIVNNWDSNARKGDPSKGLMQVIHSTFERFRDKSLPNSQTDPLANTVAALNYMGSRYGHGNAGAGLLRVASRSGGY